MKSWLTHLNKDDRSWIDSVEKAVLGASLALTTRWSMNSLRRALGKRLRRMATPLPHDMARELLLNPDTVLQPLAYLGKPAADLKDLSDDELRCLSLLRPILTRLYTLLRLGKRSAQNLSLLFDMAARPSLLDDVVLQTTYGTEHEMYGLSVQSLFITDVMHREAASGWIRDLDESIYPNDNTLGVEAVSPPLDGRGIKNLRFVTGFYAALGARAPLRCAFHVHAGIKNTFRARLGDRLTRQIVANEMISEPDLEVLNSPLVGEYGRFYNRVACANEVLNLLDQDWQEKVMPYGRRSTKINLEPLSYYGTIEFRQHPGTLCPIETEAWVKLINGKIALALDMLRVNNVPALPNEKERDALKKLAQDFLQDRKAAPPFPLFRSQDHNEGEMIRVQGITPVKR